MKRARAVSPEQERPGVVRPESRSQAPVPPVAIIVSTYNEPVTDALLVGAVEAYEAAGGDGHALSIIPAEHPQLAWYFIAFALTVPTVGFGWILIGRAIGAASGEKNAGIVRRIASVALVGFAGLIAASVLG